MCFWHGVSGYFGWGCARWPTTSRNLGGRNTFCRQKDAVLYAGRTAAPFCGRYNCYPGNKNVFFFLFSSNSADHRILALCVSTFVAVHLCAPCETLLGYTRVSDACFVPWKTRSYAWCNSLFSICDDNGIRTIQTLHCTGIFQFALMASCVILLLWVSLTPKFTAFAR